MKKVKKLYSNIIYTPFGDKLLKYTGVGKLVNMYFLKKEKLLAEAKREYENGSSLGTLSDYKNALYKHWISYNEYACQYDFPHKSEEEREEFVTRLKMVYFYLCYVPGYTKPLFKNKKRFLEYFNKYIHRKWLYAPESSYEEFIELVSNYDCIVKPCDDMRGRGIFKTNKKADQSNRELFDFCVRKRMLVEECICECEDLKVFHPQSLNTIRVVTVSNKEKAEVFGSFFRMGVGNSIVDNAHAGGIFAQVNVRDGVIESDGINTNGDRFVYHPDSKKKIKGFKIPKWDLICETCCEAAKLTENTITGWDVVINNQGDVEFVEGNNRSDFDVMQSPLQVGVKKKIFSKIKEYKGVEMR